MTTTQTDTTPEAEPKGRKPLLALVAAAALAVGAVGVGIALTAGDSEPAEVAAPRPDPGTDSGAAGTTASCIEVYDLTTLVNTEYAFDGTVVSVSDDTFTLKVEQWFHGGSGDTVTLDGAALLGAFSSVSLAPIEVEPGTRLLVAGADGFAWPCGFTQPYDETVAQAWADAFGA